MKTFYLATALCLAVLATVQADYVADPMARQVQPDDALLVRRKTCVGIGQCNDDSSHVNTDGAQIIINGQGSSTSSTTSSATSSSISTTLPAATATPASSASTAAQSASSPDGARSIVSYNRAGLVAALTASLVGACILL